jgi:hypothetical protein
VDIGERNRPAFKDTFVAIPLPHRFESEWQQLAKKLQALNHPSNAVNTENPHVRLYMLGDRSPEAINRLEELIGSKSEGLVGVKLDIGRALVNPGDPNSHKSAPWELYLDVGYPAVLVGQWSKLYKDLALHDRIIDPRKEQFTKLNEPKIPHFRLPLAYLNTPEAKKLMEDPKFREDLEGFHWQFPVEEVAVFHRHPTSKHSFDVRRLTTVKIPLPEQTGPDATSSEH